MARISVPALVPACAFLLGVVCGKELPDLAVLEVGALGALGLALRATAGRMLAWFAAGLLCALVRGGGPAAELPPNVNYALPVEVTGRVADHWRRVQGTEIASLAVVSLRQGNRVWLPVLGIALEIPGGGSRPELGSRVRAKGYLTRAPGTANLLQRVPGPLRLRMKSRWFLQVEGPPGILGRLAGALRRQVERRFWDCSRPGVALARGLVIGDPSAIPAAWRRGLKRCGLSHILSVSGLHVGLLAAVALLAGGLLPRWTRLSLAAGLIVGYLIVVGPLPALLRAAAMLGLALLALSVARPPQTVNGLAVAILILLAAEPSLIGNLGFRLSASATAGLVLLAPPLARRWEGLGAGIARALAATAGAQIASLPFALPAFHLFSPCAFLWNLLAVPWTGVVLVVDLLWVALAIAWPAAGEATGWLLDWAASPFGWFAAPPPGWLWAFPLRASGLASVALAALAAGVLFAPSRIRRAFLLGAILLALRCRPEGGATEVELLVIDVGQGDALLLRDGDRALLVDGGGSRRLDVGGQIVLPLLAELGVSRLDAIVLTHADVDHCQGLVEIASYLPVRELWLAPGGGPSDCSRELVGLAGLRLRPLWAGMIREVGRWRIETLAPRASEAGGDNARSLVLRATAASRTVLLTGDLEADGERRLLVGHAVQPCDLLKVGHHGSRTSSSRAFLAAARPRLALISCGASNPYGHPAAEVIARLAAVGARSLRTDRCGLLRLSWRDGRPIRIDLPALGR